MMYRARQVIDLTGCVCRGPYVVVCQESLDFVGLMVGCVPFDEDRAFVCRFRMVERSGFEVLGGRWRLPGESSNAE